MKRIFTHSKQNILLILGMSMLSAVLVCVAFAWSGMSCFPGPKIETKASNFTPWIWKKISVRAVGDFMPHRSVIQSVRAHSDGKNIKSGFLYLTKKIKPLIQSGDLNIVNFETPSAESELNKTRSYVFNVNPEAIDALNETGFNLFLLANNHMYDQGREGLLETLTQFKKRGIPFAGAGFSRKSAERPVLLTIHQTRIAIWNMAQFLNENFNNQSQSWVNIYQPEHSVELVKKWIDSAEVTIFVYHGGDEYSNTPGEIKQKIFEQLIDAGVLVIIAHHPHVPQPIEWIKTEKGNEGLVFYSLGNFIGNQSRKYHPLLSQVAYGDTRDVLIASFELCLMDYGPLGKKWTVQNVGIIPCWTKNNYWNALKGEPREIYLESDFHRMRELDSKIDSLSTLIVIDSLKAKVKPLLEKTIEEKRHFIRRIGRISSIVGDEYLINPLRSK